MKLVMGGINRTWLGEILRQSERATRSIRAAVAYAQSGHELFDHCRRRQLPLTFYGLLDAEGAVSPSLLAHLSALGSHRVSCKLVFGKFHPKVIVWEGFGVYIGSANLTNAAWSENVECGVFYPDVEAEGLGIYDEIEGMFEYLDAHSHPLTEEIVRKVTEFEARVRPLSKELREEQRRFDQAFVNLKRHEGVGRVPAAGVRANPRRDGFMREWNSTLQLLRDLARQFAALNRRPAWVAATANPTVHFDQFLHAYYYTHLRGQQNDEDDDNSTHEKIERAFEQNRGRRDAALSEGAKFWAGLEEPPHGEDRFIAMEAPRMQALFSRGSLAKMDREGFVEAMSLVNAFRMHARQQPNVFFGLPAHHRESVGARARRLEEWLWSQHSAEGKSVREVLDYVIWSDQGDMELRLWNCVYDSTWRLEHLGRSTFGEVVGWARPDRYPPRNNRTNKALRALGHDVALFGE